MIGTTLSHYRLLRRLGGGGMGEVYEAEDLNLARHVALKLLPPELAGSREALDRFRREARAASALNHPHICVVHDVGTDDGRPFIVMELMEGRTLKRWIGEGPLEMDRLLELGVQITDALEAAHARGIIHRDVKPANIFVTERGQAKLLDFGIAKQAGRDAADAEQLTASVASELTGAGTVLGTLAYMSPEQARGRELDGRTDLFSLGVVLYEMATGSRAFREATSVDLLDAILNRVPVSPARLNPAVPTRLEEVIAKAMEKDRELRYQSATELRADLQRLRRDAAGLVVTTKSAAHSGLPRSARGPRIAGAAVVLAVALAAAIWAGRPADRSEPAPAGAESGSLAVLPFVDMSPGRDQEYFADGLAEELMGVLSKIPELRVTGRTSAFQFKGRSEDLRVIGQKLNVATILEGSVRKADRRVRITAQLVSVADGFHLWSESYDRELDDIFAVQAEIAAAVSDALKVKLLGVPSRSAGDVEAYNLFLQGRYFFERRSQEDLEKAASYLERALEIDPGHARAWAALANVHWVQTTQGSVPVDEGSRQARREAGQALELDPDLAEAHAVLGWIRLTYDWDPPSAVATLERALQLEPGNPVICRMASLLAGAMGRFDEALELNRRAIELDPLSVPTVFNLGVLNRRAHRFDEAEAAFRKALELNPEYHFAHQALGGIHLLRSELPAALEEMEREPEPFWRRYGLALVYHALGREAEADAALAEISAANGGDAAYQIAQIHAFRGERDEAFAWLERAFSQRDGGLMNLLGDPLLVSLEDDPRYRSFVTKLRLPLS
jgi:serine/threonine-protein kinase